MTPLHVSVKTGFKILNPYREVIIREKNGTLFYSTEAKTPNVKEFNLPPGDYYVDKGHFRSMPKPVEYPLMTLPPKERNRPIPNGVPIVWGKNENKCSIIWRVDGMGNVIENAPARKILMDKSLKDYSQVERDFIKYHEFSHAHYNTEKYCDLKAANYMILKGYNPIQIGVSQIDSLSGRQLQRKRYLVDKIVKTYKKFI